MHSMQLVRDRLRHFCYSLQCAFRHAFEVSVLERASFIGEARETQIATQICLHLDLSSVQICTQKILASNKYILRFFIFEESLYQIELGFCSPKSFQLDGCQANM